MKTNEYKILVLSDLKDESKKALSYAAKLAKEINAKVELLHIKTISKIAQMENPIAISREISEVQNKMNKQINDFIQPVSEENNIKIETTFSLGNIKNVIEKHIKTINPDMIILGERRPKKFNIFSDNIIKYVNKIYDGVVFEATDASLLDERGNVSLNNLGLKNNIANYNTSKAKEKVKV